MTVEELIRKLQEYPPEYLVVIRALNGQGERVDLDEVYYDEYSREINPADKFGYNAVLVW